MTIALDQSVRIGNWTITAIVNRTLSFHSVGAVSFQASKRPIAILARCAEAIVIFGLDG